MIDSADWLCEKHFGRTLIDKDVDILDPATGTGTFVCELIDRFAGQAEKLAHKYRHELHANEVAILPYYVANLNIEATYAAAAGRYEEFPGLCFVDTLDNTFALRKHKGHIDDLFGSVSDDNIKRIRQQNSRRISVIIGNPPYNANQLNENENNKNREYPEIDKRIKETYIAASTAQKTKLYDMYARFFRWAADRLDENGVLAFITNRSFIESRTFDGFRAVAAKEFNEIRIIDLGGDVRANPKLSGTTHNVFGIQIGVAISFMVRRAKQRGCRIFYARRPEMETAEEKLSFLSSARLSEIGFQEILPDPKHRWINLTETDFDSLLPLASKESKLAKNVAQENAIFKLFSLGVVTSRDEWVYDESKENLIRKVGHFVDIYERERERWRRSDKSQSITDFGSREIKWTSELETHVVRGTRLSVSEDRCRIATYRPFCKLWTYYEDVITHRLYQQDSIFPVTGEWANLAIVYTQPGSQKPFMACAVSSLPDLHFVGAAAGTECLPLWRFEGTHRTDNITDWALQRFIKHYRDGRRKGLRAITKQAIFHYVYGVLHDPVYRDKYALNLKRDFPHIPFYPDFWQWADWGRTLMDLHIGYESVSTYPLVRTDVVDERAQGAGLSPKPLLRADKDAGRIELDTETTLGGIPPSGWQYKLGNRSALEWILDQHKEKTPKDPTIRAVQYVSLCRPQG